MRRRYEWHSVREHGAVGDSVRPELCCATQRTIESAVERRCVEQPLQYELRRCAVGQSTAAELRGSEFQRRTTVRAAWRGEPAGVCIAREHRRKHGVDRRNGRTCVATV